MRFRFPYLYACLLCLLGWLSNAPTAQATHIVGGEVNYRCLGNDLYEIELVIFRDCLNGAPNAFFDNPASIGIYYGQTSSLYLNNLIPFDPSINDTLDIVLEDSCLSIASGACTHTTYYRDTVLLPYHPLGYTLAYQRCCRNYIISNIFDPNDFVGATYWTFISPQALSVCNSSATFNEWPRIYLCNGVPLLIDHSATDVDGDSIVYELCTPSDGDFTSSVAPSPAGPPPYTPITWIGPYSQNNMLGGTDPLRINQQTGLIQGTPSTNGVFLVGVCLREYRNGVLISVTRRDFQHIVGPCTPEVVADFSTTPNPCNTTLNYSFTNRGYTTSGGFLWTYDSLGTSTATNGAFVFPDTGTYTVTLVAGVGSPCLDTFSMQVNAQVQGLQIAPLSPLVACDGDTVTLSTSNLLGNYNTVTNYQWTPIGDLVAGQGTASAQFAVTQSQTIQVVATNNFGCTDVAATNIVFQDIDAEFSFNVPPCNTDLDITFINQSTSNPPTNSYEWDFGGAGTATGTNPTFNFPDTGDYTIQLIAGANTACPDTFSISTNLQIQAADLILPITNITACEGEVLGVRVFNALAGYSSSTSYTWSPNSLFASGQGTDTVTFTADTTTQIQVVAVNSFGCTDSSTFDLTTIIVRAAFDTVNLACNTSLVIPFVNQSFTNVGAIDQRWDAFGVGSSLAASPTFTFPDTGNYTVQLIVGSITPCPDTATLDFYLPLYGVDLQNLAAPTACIGDSVWLTVDDRLARYSNSIQYTWSPSSAILAGQGTDSVLVIPTGATTIRVDAINSHLCPDSLETTIAVEIVEAAFDSVDLVCNTSLILPFLNRSTTNLDSLTYNWQVSDGNSSTLGDPTFVFADTGNYTVQLIAGTNSICPDTIEQAFYLPLEGVLLAAPDVTVFCKGDTVKLTVVDALEAYSDSIVYQWLPSSEIIAGQGTDTASAFLNQQNQVYQVIGTNSFGCVDTAELVGTIQYPWPILSIGSTPDSIFLGQSVQLLATNDASYLYRWQPDSTLSSLDTYDPTARPRQNQWYILTVENNLGCTTTDSVLVFIKAPICGEPVLFMPNAFSPDGDGYNDVLLVNGNNITDMTLEIYNRWGQRVFATTDQSQGWDGTFGGAVLPPDVYGFYLRCVCDDGSTFFKKGNITLLR